MEQNITSLRIALEVELSAMNDTLMDLKFAANDTNDHLATIAKALTIIAEHVERM
jgi:hypothetical protein